MIWQKVAKNEKPCVTLTNGALMQFNRRFKIRFMPAL